MIDLTSLHQHSLFGGITEGQIEEIRAFFNEEVYEKGDFIEREGERGDRIFFITDGGVEIIKKLKFSKGYRQLLILTEGETFGEMELIDVQPCAASVRALENTRTLTLTNRGLYGISKLNCRIFSILIMNLARDISRRLRKEDEMLAEIQSSKYTEETE